MAIARGTSILLNGDASQGVSNWTVVNTTVVPGGTDANGNVFKIAPGGRMTQTITAWTSPQHYTLDAIISLSNWASPLPSGAYIEVTMLAGTLTQMVHIPIVPNFYKTLNGTLGDKWAELTRLLPVEPEEDGPNIRITIAIINPVNSPYTLSIGKLAYSPMIDTELRDSIEELSNAIVESRASWTIEADSIRGEVNQKITTIEGTIVKQQQENNSQFDIFAGLIAAKASSTTVNELGTRVNNIDVSINAIEGQVSSKVSQQDFNGTTMVSLINQTAYGVIIDAAKIDFRGVVTIAGLGPGGTVTVDSGRITGSTFIIGNGTSSQMTLTSIAGSHSIRSVDAAGMTVGSSGSLSLQSGSGYATFVKGGPLAILGNFRIHTGTTEWTDTWVQANQNARTFTVYGTVDATNVIAGGSYVASQTWVQNLGYATQSYVTSALSGVAQWHDTYRLPRGGASLKFLAGSATIQARNYWDSSFGNFEGTAYSNVSLRELKKEIEPLEVSALKLIAETPVYTYRYNEEEAFELKHTGIMFDEAPVEIISPSGGIDVYGMAALGYKGIQELYAEMNELKAMVNKLLGGN